MKADMTVRAFALKEEEARQAVQERDSAAAGRDAAAADNRRLSDENETLRKTAAAAVEAKGRLQNDLYAAQVRIDNLSRALAAHGFAVPLPPPPTPPPAAPAAVAETKAPAPAPAADAAPAVARTHTVAEGETLSVIAFKYYGSPNKWDKIFDANRDKLKSPDQVRPGLVLKIP